MQSTTVLKNATDYYVLLINPSIHCVTQCNLFALKSYMNEKE